MTASTSAGVARAHRRPQWVRAAGWQLQSYIYMMAWGWGLLILLVATILTIVSRTTNIEVSGVAFSHHGLLWFPFSVAIMVTTMYLPVHVTNGLTRRSFTKAALASGLIIGVANAVFTMIALLVERMIYSRLGWFHGHNDGDGIDLFENGALAYGVGLLLIFVGGMLSGLLVGTAYYRLGGWWGTIMLPLTLLPIVGTAFTGLVQSSQWTPWSFTLLSDWVTAALLGVLILLAGALAFILFVRNIPISTRKD